MAILTTIFQSLFDTSHYRRLTDRERALTIYFISAGMLILATIMLFAVTIADTGEILLQRALHDPTMGVPVVSLYVLTVAAFWLTRSGRLNMGAVALVVAWTLSFGAASAVSGLYTASTGMILITTVLLSALLLRLPGLGLGVVLTLLLLIVGLMLRPNLSPPSVPNSESELVTNTLVIAIFVMLVYAFIRFARATREEGLVEAAEERFKLSEVTSQITRRISSRLDLAEVLDQAVDYVIHSYAEVYHAQIFLVDEDGKRARLAASTGDAGRQLMALQHSLEVGSQSVIGQVTTTGQPMVARARALGTMHRRNEYLPDTRVEAAFPLLIGDKVIGAVDLQSKEEVAFTETEMPIFQTLADHIAIAIDNARLFEETAARLKENERLALQSQQTLHRVEELNQRLTRRVWSDFLGVTHSTAGLDVDFEDNSVQSNTTWTPQLEAVVREESLMEQEIDGRRVVLVPMKVRGTVIGAMEFDLDEAGQLSEEDRQLIEEVSERFGLAAENARLFAESQRIAQREALINEVSARLQATSNVETTLVEAARGLQQMLKAGRVSIRLGEPPVMAGNGKDGAA